MESIGDRIRRLRKEASLSQAALAKLVGVTPAAIGNVESGLRGRPRDLLSLAKALGVDPYYLETGKNPPGSNASHRSESTPDSLAKPLDSLSARLQRAAAEAGLTQLDIAKSLGIALTEAENWFDGTEENLSAEHAIGISGLLRVHPYWLIKGKGVMHLPTSGDIATEPRPIRVFDENDPVTDDEVEVRRLDFKASAGNGRLQWEADEKGLPNRYRRSWAKRYGYNPHKLTTIEIEGDSMAPTLVNGGTVVINTEDNWPRAGKIYALDYEGEFFLKRIFFDQNNGMRITSDNPDKSKYPEWVITQENGDRLRILGRVVQTQNDI